MRSVCQLLDCATESSDRGQWTLGLLVREQYGEDETFLLGFTTHTGTVCAASDWDAPAEFKPVLASRADSIERLLHDTGLDRFMLPLRHAPKALLEVLTQERLQRAIGVICRPDTERWSHYFGASISQQFDAVVHLDTTRALQPMGGRKWPEYTTEPETYPTGM